MAKHKPLPGAGVRVENPDRTFSTERTVGVNINGKEYVIPTLIQGKQVDVSQAVQEAMRRGLHNYPSFNTPEEAAIYARNRSHQIGSSGLSGLSALANLWSRYQSIVSDKLREFFMQR